MTDIYSNLHGTTESEYVVGSDTAAGDRRLTLKSSAGTVEIKTTPGAGTKTVTIPAQNGTVAFLSDIGASVSKVAYQSTAPTDTSLYWAETDNSGKLLHNFVWQWNGTNWVSPLLERQMPFPGIGFTYAKFSRQYASVIKKIDLSSLYSDEVRYLVSKVDGITVNTYDLGSVVSSVEVEYAPELQLSANKVIEYSISDTNLAAKISYGAAILYYQLIRI